MEDALVSIKPAVVAGVLALLWLAEGIAPMFRGRAGRARHDGVNILLGLMNAAVVALLLAGLVVNVTQWAADRDFGLLRFVEMSVWAEWLIAIILFDLWMYLWHVANHKLPLLWRFHRVHHADRSLAASSAMRFHTGEIVLSSLARLAVVPALGMSLEQLLVYEILLQPVILLHHSNTRLPERLDRILRSVIVTPRIHWVHHSSRREETDSNYGSILSFWDRLFRTLRWRKPSEIRFGLDSTGEEESDSLCVMMKMPFDEGKVAGQDSNDPS